MMCSFALLVFQATAPPRAPEQRAHHWLVYDPGAKAVALMGGSTPVGNGFRFYDDWWSFDGEAWSWVRGTGRPLSGERVVWSTQRDRWIAFGGFTPESGSLGELREWSDGAWSTIDPAEELALAEAGFVCDARRARFVLFGGSRDREKSAATYEWDGNAWHAFDGAGPPARNAHGMVYDERRGKVVVFGGAGASGPLGDTWEFDGASWSCFEGVGPPARLAPAMAYDSKRGRTLLFGGGGAGKPLGDTWSFDGERWTELDAPGPCARIAPAMAFDPGRDRMVLFGGRRGWPDDLADTWVFDGERWREVRAP